MKIGFLDSGIGGLSVLKAFIHFPIHAEYIYIADTAHLPYGLKSHEYIHNRVQTLTHYLIHHHHIDMLVIACNTATAISAKKLRKEIPHLPIIGIEPAIKPAALASKSKEIAILATESMINNGRLDHLINEYANEVTVIKIVASSWVTLVEDGILDGNIARATIQTTLDKIGDHPIDQLILGCTHFPFLMPTLKTMLKPGIALVDPAIAVAKHAVQSLCALNTDMDVIANGVASTYHYLTTGNLDKFSKQISYFTMPQGTIQHLDV